MTSDIPEKGKSDLVSTSDSTSQEDRTVDYLDYVPGTALAAIDAKMAQMDCMFKKLMKGAGLMLQRELLAGIPPPDPSPTSLIRETTVQAVADHLPSCRNVIVLTGAGISTAAGIPDFRSKGTGLYENVQSYLDKFNLSSPNEVFSFELFQRDPQPFYSICKDLKYPDASTKPTLAHHFIKLLSDKGVLLRNYTQNIDMLQSDTGIPEDKVFEVHGSFRSGTCMKCRAKLTRSQMKEAIFSGKVAKCGKLVNPVGDMDKPAGREGAAAVVTCGGIIKPGIVMFGEQLPQDYLLTISGDEGKCDLLIVMGTSLSVGPVNKIPNDIPRSTPRLLINREKVCTDEENHLNHSSPLFFFDHPDNKTDVFMGGDIEEGVATLVKKIGWWEELQKLAGTLTEN